MKKIRLLFITLLAAAMLAACGTTKKEQNSGSDGETEKESTETVDEGNGKQEGETEKADGTDTETGQNAGEQPESESDEDPENGSEKIRLMEQNLSYQVNGETKEETAFLKESDNQAYSLYVLPDYELTGEEPRKDVLYLKEDDTLFMRIELLPEDAVMENETETAKAQLESVSSDIKEAKPEGHDWLNDAKGFTADNGTDKVSTYLIPKEAGILKLTIFTPAKGNAEDPFLKMAETIESR